MGANLTEDGEWCSDKYPWCPPGFFPMKFSDPIARDCILAWAELTEQEELADELREAIEIINEKERGLA